MPIITHTVFSAPGLSLEIDEDTDDVVESFAELNFDEVPVMERVNYGRLAEVRFRNRMGTKYNVEFKGANGRMLASLPARETDFTTAPARISVREVTASLTLAR